MQREAAQRFRKGLYLRQDGFGARIQLRTGKAGPVADAKTGAKVNCICRGAGFLIQRLCQRGKLGEDSGIEVLVHAQLAQPHTEAKPAYAACAQAFRRAQERFAFHPGIAGRDARHRLRAEAELALLPQEQNYGLRHCFGQQLGSVQHENCAERMRSFLRFRAADRRLVGDFPAMEAAPGGKLQLRKAPAKHAAAAAAQNLQNRGIRIHADGKARQESVAVGKCTEKSLRCLHETLFIV